MRLERLLSLGTLMAVLAAAPLAFGADPEVEAGRALREKGDLAGARKKLDAAFRKHKTAAGGYELALVLRGLGDLNGAYDILRQVGDLEVDRDEELEAKRHAKALLDEIDPLIPMVFIDLGGGRASVAKIVVDDTVLVEAEWAEAQPVNPGKHTVVVVLKDGSGLKKVFTVAESARVRLRFDVPKPEGANAEGAKPEGANADEEQPDKKVVVCPAGAVLRKGECIAPGNSYLVANIAADVGFFGALAVGFAAKSPPAALAGLIGIPFASPIVHWSQGKVGRGFASFGLHMAAGLGTLVTVAATANDEGEINPGTAAAVTALWGGIAIGLDALILRHEADTKVAPISTSAWLPSIAVAPVRGGAAATLAFNF